MPRRRRADIQGLRAVAVLLVIAHHLDVGLAGGYLGVDVFFVISGFVISGMLRHELVSTGRPSILRFYARRVRRLWPALAAMTVVVLAVNAVVLNPYDAQPFAVRTAVAAHLLVANLYLYRHVGYFDESAAQNPFLHTWSLSVEEQLCLLLPVVLWFAWRRRRPVALVGVVVVASYALWVALDAGAGSSVVAVPERLAFFAMPTRVWQFGAGVLLALVWERVAAAPPVVHRLAALVAVGALAVAVGTAPPTPAAETLAVAGAVAAIVAGAGITPVRRALSSAPMVRIGDISYAWYLWHWPMLVWAGVLWADNLAGRLGAVCLSAGCAVASTALIERPIREGRPLLGRVAHPARVAVVCTVVPLMASGAAWIGADRGWGVDVPIDWWDLPAGRQVGCTLFNRDVANTWPDEPCRVRVDRSAGTVLVVGDQHADAVAEGVEVAARSLSFDTAVWNRTDCPMSARAPADFPRCRDWQAAVLDLIARERPAVVVIANQSSRYLDVDGPVPIADADGIAPADRADAVANWNEGTADLLDVLGRHDVPVVLVGPAPDFGHAFPRRRVSVLRPDVTAPAISVATAERQRAGAFEGDARNAERRAGVALVDPLDRLCRRERCPTEVDGRWWYYEPRYLTATGGRRLGPDLGDAMRTAIAERSG